MTDLDTRHPEFTMAIRGYDRLQVDEYIERLQKLLSEAEERVRAAESEHDFSSHTSIGPRLAEIFELAGAEAKEIRTKAGKEARERLDAARADAKEIVKRARETAKATAEQAAGDYEAMLAGYQQERERIRAQVGELDAHKAAVIGELRRLQEAISTSFGTVEPRRKETVLALEGSSELTTMELPRRASTPVRKAS
jgi:cell division septum initiation protein DivIVA